MRFFDIVLCAECLRSAEKARNGTKSLEFTARLCYNGIGAIEKTQRRVIETDFIEVTPKSKNLRKIKKLYKTAFPKDERAPFWLLTKRAKSDCADFWALYDGEEFIGMAYVVRYEALAYLFYLAIDDGKRGKGYGTKAITELKARYGGGKLFLALEQLDESAPNYEQRLKRHAFYESCGLHDLPHKIKEASVVYAVMGFGEAVEPEEYEEMMKRYLGGFLYKTVDVRMID